MTTPYSEFFLNNTGAVVQYETLEISHPNFTKTYRVVRNSKDGLRAKYEDENYYDHDYYPLGIQSIGARGDLDQGFQIVMGDLGEVLPTEMDSVSSADAFHIKPVVKYRTFRSDDLDDIMFGPLSLEVDSFSFTREASTFQAKAPSLNISTTGELYRTDRFPMLRGFL